MFYISEIYNKAPESFETKLQEMTYNTLDKLNIKFERVLTDEAITMEDCIEINKALKMKMVKTLFLCNRQKTEFYLYVTTGDKKFDSKNFSAALGIARVSFAPSELMGELLGTKIGAATVFSLLLDVEKKVQIVFDKDVLMEEFYGCSDGTTTGYMKIKTNDIIEKLVPATGHKEFVIEM